ncbi:MAG: penicillin-binding protein 1A [Robiginitomaculum sp.]|nr:penicillin-binding protein 1A [Robiginitomaculum sp.]
MNTNDPQIIDEIEPVKSSKSSRWPKFWKIVKYLFATGFVLGVFALIFVGVFIARATRDLPTLEAVQQYAPAVMSRVHAGDGKLIAEYGIEKRVFVPIESIPKQIQHALVASEDQRFYTHDGFDPKGFARAMVANVGHKLKGQRLEGGSTLTQQVAKHFLVGDERNVARKIRDIFIARRIEKAISKDDILELYLNDVYFGRRAYGIAGASLNYFNKPLDKLTLGEMAYLAGLVKGPANYQLGTNKERAINRRNYVLNRMAEDGYITAEQKIEAKREDLAVAERLRGDEYLAAEYFVAEVRKQINGLYGEEQLNEGGLSIRTTLDTKMQLMARKALRRGLEMYDRRHGYRGALTKLDDGLNWQEFLAEFKPPKDIAPWQVAVVLKAEGDVAEVGFAEGANGSLHIKDIDWAKKITANFKLGPEPKSVTDVLVKGDVVLVEVKPKTESGNEYNLRQIPDANGGIIAMDPHTGRVLALVGGYSFSQSQFNRATQAYRQPGSSFKPFVYMAALDGGMTPSSQILDAPFVIERNDRNENCVEQVRAGQSRLVFGPQDPETPNPASPDVLSRAQLDANGRKTACGPVFYKPANFNAGQWYGLSTLRLGIEKSRNAMTVRLANDIGMRAISRYGRSFGIYDETKPELAWALGAGETTLLRMASAYATIVNGGKKVTPTLLDRVQDSKGETVYSHDNRACPECAMDEWGEGMSPPELPDEREVVVSPVTAYQMTSMLEGVVKRGTGQQMLRLDRPMAGKTGTTNDFKDAWFMGFSPDLVVGVYVGHDTPRSLGTETGSQAAGPIFRFFMADALKDKPKVAFRIPDGVLLAPVDQDSGETSYIGAPNFIYEAFRPGTEPRIGDTRRKINVGGGGRSYDGFDFGFGTQGKQNERAEQPAQDGEAQNGEDVPKPADVDTPVALPQPKPPLPKPEDQEDDVDLDDGLY